MLIALIGKLEIRRVTGGYPTGIEAFVPPKRYPYATLAYPCPTYLHDVKRGEEGFIHGLGQHVALAQVGFRQEQCTEAPGT